MQIIAAKSAAELRAYIDAIDRPMLFRGQTRHYGGTHSPAVISSFDRLGCIPDQMLRWSYYAHGALKYALGKTVESLPLAQAVLQHYGWRSFFLDVSTRVEVASWFAAHSYRSEPSIHLCEDCFEDPMFLRKPGAAYELEKGTGHLYVIDPTACEEAGVGLHDLTELDLPNGRPRFRAQSAWLLGPQKGNLPLECFHSRIIADRQILADIATEGGLTTTLDLFPHPDEDVVLNALLHLPWTELTTPEGFDGPGIPAFRRTVEIPEYHDGFIKIHPPAHAFYRRKMLADLIGTEDSPQLPFAIHRMPTIVMMGVANPVGDRFPALLSRLTEEQKLAFEIDELIRLSETGPSYEYGKGLVLTRKESGLIEVGELIVEHPGMQIAGWGTTFGWHYFIQEDGRWVRSPSSEDCPCGDDDRHLRHLSTLTILEHWLNDPAAFED